MTVLPQRTVLISGASRGIGRSIAERLLLDGHRLSLGVRHPNDLLSSSLEAIVVWQEHLSKAFLGPLNLLLSCNYSI